MKVKEIWSYALFVPITMYIFQTISVINDDVKIVDQVEFIYCLPISLFYFFLLYLYKRFLNKLRAKRDYERELVQTGLEGLLNKE